MQSGQDRGLFSSESSQKVHLEEVSGLGIDCLNKHLVSCSIDSTIKIWDFYRRVLIKSVEMGGCLENLTYNRINDLVAFSTSNLTITVMNAKMGNLRTIRTFEKAAKNKITDICFS